MSAAVYAVTYQLTGVSQGLGTAKSRLAKKGLSTTTLKLVSGHMAAIIVDNVREALEGFPAESVYCWLDHTIDLPLDQGRWRLQAIC